MGIWLEGKGISRQFEIDSAECRSAAEFHSRVYKLYRLLDVEIVHCHAENPIPFPE